MDDVSAARRELWLELGLCLCFAVTIAAALAGLWGVIRGDIHPLAVGLLVVPQLVTAAAAVCARRALNRKARNDG